MLALASASRAQGIAVVVDGASVAFPGSPPFEHNGSVLVPLRGVFERLGAGVNYNPETRTIEATKGQTDVILRLGDSTAYINQQAQPLLQPPLVVNGSTFVPLRFVAQSFGAQVNWIAATQTVDIHTADETANDDADNTANVPAAVDTVDNTAESDDGPVRLARFSDVEGNVTWRTTGDTDWSPAAPNIPLREGAQIWDSDGGRAEIQFDDGSWLRLGDNAVATLQTLSSDSGGEYTEIELSQGVAFLHLINNDSTYQVDTTLVSVKAAGPAKIRVDDTNGVRIAVRDGTGEVSGNSGNAQLQAGSYLRLTRADDVYNVGALPPPDGWDQWNDSRDTFYDTPNRYLPPNIALVAGNLDRYGDWNQDPRYGTVWTPRVSDGSWRPYENGRWVWVNPFGWTWVAGEPWGWAPYHYGTWVREPFGWSWVPGPRQQYWSPAVVNFTEYQGNVCWAPLAPTEVHYPPRIALTLRGSDWSLNFSIGGCAVYYPVDSRSCAPRPWNNRQVNAVNITNIRNISNNTTIVNETTHIYPTKYVFVPQNAAGGATLTSASTFGHAAGAYQPIQDNTRVAFLKGRPAAAPAAVGPVRSGPVNIPPTRESLTPARVFTPAPPAITAVLSRRLFQAPPPAQTRTTQPRRPMYVEPNAAFQPVFPRSAPRTHTLQKPTIRPRPTATAPPTPTAPVSVSKPRPVRPAMQPAPPTVNPVTRPVPRVAPKSAVRPNLPTATPTAQPKPPTATTAARPGPRVTPKPTHSKPPPATPPDESR